MTDFKKLKVVELRAELAARNLPQTGKRDELIERLEEYEFHHAMPTDTETETQTESQVQTIISPVISDAQQNPSISPVLPPSPVATDQLTTAEIEEEKRRQRAIRFGLDPAPAVKIEVAIKRLEHALPNRSHDRNRHRHHHHKHRNDSHRQVSINKP